MSRSKYRRSFGWSAAGISLVLGWTWWGDVGDYWLILGIGMLGAVTYLRQFSRPYELRLDCLGMTLTGGWRREPLWIPWREIETFRFGDIDGPEIKVKFEPGKWRYLRFPNGWTFSEREMVERLNDYRRRALGSFPTQP